MKKKPWTKKRHARVFKFLRGVFRIYTKKKYNYTAEVSDISGACVIMCNHTTTLDPFFVSLSFNFPIYFFASDDLFNVKVVSPIIKHLVAPIPKSKSVSDLQSVRDSLKVLKEGGAVGLFPEGNRTLSGGQWEITDAAAKLIKLSKVPLVLYNIEGGYGSDPRWGIKPRKGKMRGYVKRVINSEEYAAMSTESLLETIKKELMVDDTLSGVKFKSRRRAENIERALYMCPECGEIGKIRSRGGEFTCTACGAKREYTEDLHIAPKGRFNRIYEWYEWEKSVVAEKAKSGEIKFSDEKIKFYQSVKLKRKRRYDGSRITADETGLTIYGKNSAEFYPFDKMEGFALVGKRKINFYIGGRILQIKGNKKFCPLKYLHLYEGIKNV